MLYIYHNSSNHICQHFTIWQAVYRIACCIYFLGNLHNNIQKNVDNTNPAPMVRVICKLLRVKWKTKFWFKLIWPRIFDFEQLFWRYPIQKYPEKCYNPCYKVCLFAWQTDDWSSLRKNKFHPSNIRNEVGFCDSWLLGGYLSASFMIIPAGKCQSSGETNIDLLDGIFVL